MDSFEQILERMKTVYETESGSKVADVSEIGLRLRLLAGELYRLEASLDWLEQQAFPQTAVGEQLDRHGELRGMARHPAEKAVGTVTFSRYLPLTFDLVVPAGTVCATSGEPVVEYITTEDGILEAGELSVDVPVEAAEAGAAGNAAAGYVSTLVTAPTGINYVSNRTAITGGQDGEADEAYRARILDSFAHCPNGTNADYYRKLALEQAEIVQVQVVPRASGAGTVTLYVWGEGAAPSAAAIAALKAVLDEQREVGVTVTVQAAQQFAMDIRVNITVDGTVDFSWAKTQVENALWDYFAGRSIGDPLSLTDITRVVLNAAPVTEVEFPSSMMDLPGAAGRLMTARNLYVEEIT